MSGKYSIHGAVGVASVRNPSCRHVTLASQAVAYYKQLLDLRCEGKSTVPRYGVIYKT